jgi:hypothetical protein
MFILFARNPADSFATNDNDKGRSDESRNSLRGAELYETTRVPQDRSRSMITLMCVDQPEMNAVRDCDGFAWEHFAHDNRIKEFENICTGNESSS